MPGGTWPEDELVEADPFPWRFHLYLLSLLTLLAAGGFGLIALLRFLLTGEV